MNYSLRRGFTIIEITIVILIIGVLAAMAFGGMRWVQRVKIQTNNTRLAAVDTMLEQYNTQIGEYPTDLQELTDGPAKPQLQRKWGEPLAVEDELQDAWKRPFIYSVNPKGTQPPYELYSTGSTGTARILSPRSREDS